MRTLPNQPQVLDRPSQLRQAVYRRLVRFSFLPSARKYNLTISHQRKFVWFRVAKNGTRTIFDHLKTTGIPLDVEHPYNIHYPPRAFRDYFKFAFVRNPWDRLVSCWTNKIVDNRGVNFGFTPEQTAHMDRFENFVDYVATLDINTCNAHLRAQAALIDLDNVDYLGRVETFADDFRHLCQRLDIPCQAIVSKNVTQRRPYHDYYTDALAEKVARIYRRDIQLFGYRYR